MAPRKLTPWFCSVCTIGGPRFGSRAAFVDHFRRFCHPCGIEFTSHWTYLFHREQSHPPECCPLCVRSHENHLSIIGHEHTPFGCACCGKEFSSFMRLICHNSPMACSSHESTPSVLAPIQPSPGLACSSCRLAVEDLDQLHQHFQGCRLALERDMRSTALTRTEVVVNIWKSLQEANMCHPLNFAHDWVKKKPLPTDPRPRPKDVNHEESAHPSQIIRPSHCQKANGSAIPIQRQILGQKKANDNRKMTPLKLGSVEVIELIDDDDDDDDDDDEEEEEEEEEEEDNDEAFSKPLQNPSMPKVSAQGNNSNGKPSLPLRKLSASFRHRIRSKSKGLIQSDLDGDTQFLESFLLQPLSVMLNRWPSDQPVPSLAEAIPVDWEQESKLDEALNLLEYRGIDVDQLINDPGGETCPCEEMSEIQEDFGHVLTDPIDEPGNLLIGTNTFGWVTVAREQYDESVPVITLE